MWHIARHELRLILRDQRHTVPLLTYGLLLLLALWTSHGRGARDRADAAQAHDALRNEWLAQGRVNPHSAAHFGTFVQRPLPTLAALDPGVTPYVGSMLRLEAHVQHELTARPMADDGVSATLGLLSPAVFLQLLAPLVILFWTAGSFAAERERGTLSLMRFSLDRPEALVLGKALASAAGATLLVLPVVLVGLAVSRGADDATAVVLLGLCQVAYLLAFAGAGAVIGMRVRSSAAAILGGLLVWILACLVVPRIAGDLAERAYPLPAQFDAGVRIARESAQGINGHDPADVRRKAVETRLLQQYQVATVAELPVNLDGIVMQADEDYRAAVYAGHRMRVRQQLERQGDAVARLAVLSPLLTLRPVSMTLAQTAPADFAAFAEGAAEYRLALMRAMNGAMAAGSRTGDWDWRADSSVLAAVPDFVPTMRPPATRRREGLAGLGGLALWLVGSWTIALVVSRRWDA